MPKMTWNIIRYVDFFLNKLIYKDPGSMFSEPLWSKV